MSSGRFDHLIERLRDLREQAGSPSFGEITQLIVERRIDAGQDEYAARVAKSTVHDAFRYGRSRINRSLTREIVAVLGEDPRAVDEWIRPPRQEAQPPEVEPEMNGSDPEQPSAAIGPRTAALVMVTCVGVNLLGREFVDAFTLPIYLDMVGTAFAAIALGAWRGAAVGLTTNILGMIGSGWVSLPFALVNVAGALAWGYGVRRWRMGATLPRFLSLNVVVACICSAVAVPILFALGAEAPDNVTGRLVSDVVAHPELALAMANLLTSNADKLLSGFLVLVGLSLGSDRLRRHLPIATPQVVVDDPG